MSTPTQKRPVADSADYRSSAQARRQTWFGLKRYAKKLLSLRVPHFLLRALLRFAPSLRSGRLPAPAALQEVEGFVGGATFVMLHPDRCEIAKELYWGHGTRPKLEDALALDVVAALCRDADTLFDVGAYTGLFSLAGAAVNPRLAVHAFEIVPDVADALRANAARNGVTGRVTVHLEGLGDPGATMRVPRGEGGSALPSFYSTRMRFDEGTEIPFRSLDSLVPVVTSSDHVVMKVDVEGTENAIFRHGQQFLDSFKPDILCELLFGIADASELEGLLSPHAYRFYLVRDRDLLLSSRLTPHPSLRDWLFSVRNPGALRSLGLPVTETD